MTDWLEVTDAPNFPESFFENLPKNSLGNTIIKNYITQQCRPDQH
jgi:hypothetical protein